MELYEKTISSQHIFKGRIIDVSVDTVELPNGSTSTRELVRHAGAVAILPVTDDGYVWLVKQFRKPTERILLEIPAGTREAGEAPLECAVRELQEETGLTAHRWEEILSYYSAPGFCDELLYVFIARELEAGDGHPDEDEFVEVVRMKLSDAYQAIFTGEIVDGKSIIALQYAYHQMERK